MRISLTKNNLITIGITFLSATLFIIWGFYLMRDKPVEIPAYENPVTITGSTTEQYNNVFKIPLDPSIYPDEHKAVYEKIALYVPFKVMYPSQMPEGYYLTQVSTHFIYANAKENNLYGAVYINTDKHKIVSIEGEKGSFSPDNYNEIILGDTMRGVFLDAIEGPITLYVYEKDSPEKNSRYYIRSNSPETTKEDLIEIGKNLKFL